MTNIDPAAFSSETTGVFKVQPLGEAVPLSDPSVGIDEYGHRSDCAGCSACSTVPPVQDTGPTGPFAALTERLEAQAHVDEYGHPSDCNGCAAPTCGPPYGS